MGIIVRKKIKEEVKVAVKVAIKDKVEEVQQIQMEHTIRSRAIIAVDQGLSSEEKEAAELLCRDYGILFCDSNSLTVLLHELDADN